MDKNNTKICLKKHSKDFNESFNAFQKIIVDNKITLKKERFDKFQVKFYEWSNVNNTPREFNNFDVFISFLNECHIECTTEQRLKVLDRASSYSGAFIMCSSDGLQLFVEASTYGLKWEHERYLKSLEPRPTESAPSTVSVENKGTTYHVPAISPCYYHHYWCD